MVRIGRVIWPGPVGIGAGLVKGAASFVELAEKADAIEVGSITLQMRAGNFGQTVWKYPNERAIRHNAGLPNPGALGIVEHFKQAQYQVRIPWGINVAVTPGIGDNLQAVQDVVQTTRIILEGGLKPQWITVNISSPDTQDPIEKLAEPTRVAAIVKAVQTEAALFGAVPVWLKLSPSLPDNFYPALSKVILDYQVDAVVMGNTLVGHNGETGGWGGEPVRAKSLALVWQLSRLLGGKVPVVASGGVMTGAHVGDKLLAGARAVQVVSALLFRGREAALVIRREYEMLVVEESLRLSQKGQK